ncbi:pentapeptide repeat-containing protein [Lewinella cohaerens]|uniref:pentapeptide repeat-containing protein n=1 Tax=Lewinella cohaerens TaxID=70995 RepID=UPI00035CC516|nr:pentapeptide repeat-containing protein [Lewinella cohaerens]
MRFFTGLIMLIVGCIIGYLGFYFMSTGIEFTISFISGVVATLFLLMIIGVILIIGKTKLYNSESEKGLLNNVYNYSLVRLLPGLSESERKRFRLVFTKILNYRIVLSSLRIIGILIVVFGGLIGTHVLIKQNDLLAKQNDKFEDQNKLFLNQNRLLLEQTDYLKSQTELFTSQNNLIDKQTSSIEQQNSFARQEHFSTLYNNYLDDLNDPNIAIRVKQSAFYKIVDLQRRNRLYDRYETLSADNLQFRGVKLQNLVIRHFDLSKPNFDDSVISNSAFSDVQFRSGSLLATQFYDCRLSDVKFENCAFGLSIRDMRPDEFISILSIISGYEYSPLAVFENATLENVSFEKCFLRFTDFRSAIGNFDESFRIEDIQYGLLYPSLSVLG